MYSILNPNSMGYYNPCKSLGLNGGGTRFKMAQVTFFLAPSQPAGSDRCQGCCLVVGERRPCSWRSLLHLLLRYTGMRAPNFLILYSEPFQRLFFLQYEIVSLMPNSQPCWPCTTAYLIYSQLTFISGGILLSLQPVDMPCHGDKY